MKYRNWGGTKQILAKSVLALGVSAVNSGKARKMTNLCAPYSAPSNWA